MIVVSIGLTPDGLGVITVWMDPGTRPSTSALLSLQAEPPSTSFAITSKAPGPAGQVLFATTSDQPSSGLMDE